MVNKKEELTLVELGVNDRAEVTGFRKNSKGMLGKFLAMGITRGAVVKVLRYAPLGDPVDIEVKGTSLTLRKEEAMLVTVRRSDG